MRLAWCSPALVLAALLAPSLAWAAWLPGGNRIGNVAESGHGFVAASSGPERIVIAWFRQAASDRFEVRVQAWTAEGDLVAGWPSAGVLAGQITGYPGSIAIAEDGAGGAFIAWVNPALAGSSVHVQHVSASGSLAVGWAAEGIRLGENYSSAPVVTHDGAGGVLVGWLEYAIGYDYRVRIQRIDAAGALAPGWPAAGLSIPNAFDVGLAVDSAGHVFVGTSEYDPNPPARMLGMRLQRLDGSATPDPTWPAAGVVLPDIYPMRTSLFPDGTGGVFAGWKQFVICVDFCPQAPISWVARVLGDGSPHDGWKPARVAYSNAPDRTGGMLLGLVRGGRPSALRLDAGGAVMPGWSADGNVAMTEVVDPWEVLVTGDGDGGAFVVWRDDRSGEDRLYASRLDDHGRLAQGWPSTGSVVGTGGGGLSTAQLVSLGGGAAVVLWTEWTGSGESGYIQSLRPGEPGPLARLGPVGAEVGFGVVQVRPNPAHGPIVAIVELQNEGPARLDLVDAGGRVRESQEYDFQWQARGAVRFNLTRTLPAGVYWLRLTQRGRLASRKVVVLE